MWIEFFDRPGRVAPVVIKWRNGLAASPRLLDSCTITGPRSPTFCVYKYFLSFKSTSSSSSLSICTPYFLRAFSNKSSSSKSTLMTDDLPSGSPDAAKSDKQTINWCALKNTCRAVKTDRNYISKSSLIFFFFSGGHN